MFVQNYTRQQLLFDLNAVALAGISFIVTFWIVA
jgi:hypothetical protein